MVIAGDFNIYFTDNYYYTKDGRDKLNKAFSEFGLLNLTAHMAQNIYHIVTSKELVGKTIYGNC